MSDDIEADFAGGEELPDPPFDFDLVRQPRYHRFEEFCFDLLIELGFVNVAWRKGTPKKTSPSDRGRDIVAQLERTDVDGHRYFETWFVDAKHYQRGVPYHRRRCRAA